MTHPLPEGMDPLLFTASVQQAIGGITRQGLSKMVKEGRFPAPLAFGTRNAWRASVVQAWINAQQPRTPDQRNVLSARLVRDRRVARVVAAIEATK